MNKMRKYRQKSGFTLVEIIVTLAIIGIMSIAFFAMFGFGIKTIMMAGHNSESDFNAQTIMENRIAGDDSASPQLEVTTAAINLYQSGTLIKQVNGETVQVSYPYSSATNTAITFVAD